MAQEVGTKEPTELMVGTAVAWTRSFDDWTPAEGTVTYAFQPRNGGAGGFTKDATDNLDGQFRVDLAPADTTGKSPGVWTWTAKIAVAGTDYLIDSGDLEFAGNPFAGAVDQRTYWERFRDDLQAALDADDNSLVQSYSYDNRSMSKATRGEMFEALEYCEERIERDRVERELAQGKTPARRSTIRMEFD